MSCQLDKVLTSTSRVAAAWARTPRLDESCAGMSTAPACYEQVRARSCRSPHARRRRVRDEDE